MKQTCILVLGMHRSGTSALTGVLQYLNVDLGSKLASAAEDNKKGFFENTYFVNFNEKLLSKLGSSWDDVVFNYNSKKNLITSEDKNELNNILMQEFENSTLFAIKDPRICYLFPFYEEVLKEMRIDIKVLLPYRNPLEVARSLEKRNAFEYEKSIMLWLNYFLNAEKYSRGYSRYFFKFDELINNTSSIINAVDKSFDSNFYQTYKECKSKILEFLEQDLKHENINEFSFPEVLIKFIPNIDSLYDSDLNNINKELLNQIESQYGELIEFFASSCVLDYQDKIKQKDTRIEKLDDKNKVKEKQLLMVNKDFDKLKEELVTLKRNNNLMATRLKKFESHKFCIFLERLINLSQEPKSIIVKKVLTKFVPKFIFRFFQNRSKNKIINELLNSQGKKIIVVFPIIAWGFRWQRPQHMISRLAKKGYTIIYVAKDFDFYKTTKEQRDNIIDHIRLKKLDDNIFKVYLNSLTELNIYNNRLDKDNTNWFIKQLYFLLYNSLNTKEIIYYVQFPNWLNLVKKLQVKNKGRVVFDCMDEHSGFSNVDQQIIEHEKELIKISDVVISSSNKLYDKNILQNSNTVKIKNGTEFEFFNRKQESYELKDLSNKPIIGYYGAIADWFDIDLIEYCAKKRPHYNFVLIGSTFSCKINNANKLHNIYFLGEKSYKDLPKYLYKFDVCTIPFKLIPLIESTNPVKFYEYISAGKPVVSTKLPELEEFKDICYLAQTKEEFLSMLDKALAEKEFDNFEQLIQKRIDIAKDNSWDSRVESLYEEIEGLK